MMIQIVITKAYTMFLRKKWNMKNTYGASLLGGWFRRDYKRHPHQILKVWSIHKKGFSWDDWHVNELTNENCSEYLNTAQYCAMHPLNGRYSHWIDDKLTLKYLCAGTPLDKYMPEYYYQIDDNGKVLALSDAGNCKKARYTAGDIVTLLESVGELAVKRVSGSLGEGFYKASYKNGKYYLNDKVYSERELVKAIGELKDYLITEYLHPHKDLVPYCADTANCIRYLIGRDDNGEMKRIKSFIRLGTVASGFVENYNAGGVLCYINENGDFENGNIFDSHSGTNRIVSEHPDTKQRLEGKIPLWSEVQKAAEQFGVTYPQMQYLGIDFVITNKNEVKILEINSLTSLDSLQLDGSILEKPQGDFYKKRINC